ncbi:MAG: pyridoxamine 5'-phosphate oxidase family protein [Acutalibacteraceae bacterium]|jgi:nitroimidazol reductase NimA-like FMN-containing flavoprotein (pyridoxamine 5'-phosphate oxidase superfamily)
MTTPTRMTYEDARALLNGGRYGVLAAVGDGDTPYGVPLCYLSEKHRIWFCLHPDGQLSRLLSYRNRVSFTAVEAGAALPGRSVIAFGEIAPLTDPRQKKAALQKWIDKYGAPPDPDAIWWRMDCEYLSGQVRA